MKMDVTDCEALSLDSDVMTIRIIGQPPINLPIRNPHRLAEDLPVVIAQSRVLSGDGQFVPDKDAQ